jgi:hypothetical protein
VAALQAQLAAGEAERKESLVALLATEQAKLAAVAELSAQVRGALAAVVVVVVVAWMVVVAWIVVVVVGPASVAEVAGWLAGWLAGRPAGQPAGHQHPAHLPTRALVRLPARARSSRRRRRPPPRRTPRLSCASRRSSLTSTTWASA